MEIAFRAIGFKGIEDHHVTTPAQVAARFDEAGFALVTKSHLEVPARGLRLYSNWLLEKRAGMGTSV